MKIVHRREGLVAFSTQAIRMLLIAGVILISGCGDTSSSGESENGESDDLKAATWGESNWDESEWK